MQNGNEILNKLFDLAKKEAPLFASNQAEILVQEHARNAKKIKIRKIMTYTSILLVIGTTAGLLFNKNTGESKFNKIKSKAQVETEKQTEPGTFKEHQSESLPGKKSKVVVSGALPYVFSKINDEDTGKKKLRIERKLLITEDVGVSNDIRIENNNRTDTSKLKLNKIVTVHSEELKLEIDGINYEKTIPQGYEKSSFVCLDKSTLQKLGIYLKDTIFMYEMKGTRIGDLSGFFNNQNQTRTSSVTSKNQNRNPLLKFVTNSFGQMIATLGVFEAEIMDEHFIEKSKELLPVWVEDEESNQNYIAWFEINSELISRLPEPYKTNLTNNKDFYSHSLPQLTSILENPNRENTKTSKIKNESLDISPSQITKPEALTLKKLGFQSINPIIFDRIIKTSHNQLSIYLDNFNKNGNIQMSLDDTLVDEQTVENIFPSFMSRFDQTTGKIFDITAFRSFGGTIFEKNSEKFLNKQFELVGLVIELDSVSYIFWYDPIEDLLDIMSRTEKEKLVSFISSNKNRLNGIEINPNSPQKPSVEEIMRNQTNNSPIPTLSLNAKQLGLLNIKIQQQVIAWRIPSAQLDSTSGKSSSIEFQYDKEGTKILINTPSDIDTTNYIYPALITDDIGAYARTPFGKTYELNKISSYNLIPVLVRSGQTFSTFDKLTKKHRPDLIFWYEPTEAFLKVLENKVADEIRNDIVALNCNRTKLAFNTETTCDEKAKISCNYFEACKNTVNKAISKYEVYPNPAIEKFNVKLDLKESCKVNLVLFALNGEIVNTYSLGNMQKGINQQELHVNGIAAGIYLLRITTDKGDVFNERIFINPN